MSELNQMFVQTTVSISLSIMLVMSTRRMVLRHFGAVRVYLLWWAPVLALLMSLLGLFQLTDGLTALAGSVSLTVFAGQSTEADALGFWPEVTMLWLLAAVIFFGFSLTRNQCWLRRTLNTAIIPDATLSACWQALREQHSYSHNMELWLSERVSGPMAIGLWRRRVFVPLEFQSRHSPSQISLILHHEYVHLQRRDALFNLIAHGLRCLFWFNPLAYVGYQRFRADQELSCDARVLEGRNRATASNYADALLNTASMCNPTGAMALNHSLNHLKERLTMLNPQKPVNKIAAGISLALLLTTSATIGIAAAGKPTDVDSHAKFDQSMVSPIHREAPRYPAQAAKDRIEGSVTMRFTVQTDGTVGDVQVTQSHPLHVFDEAAVTAIKAWRFNIIPAPQEASQTFDFKIDE